MIKHIFPRLFALFLTILSATHLKAQEVNDSIDTYTNQTVSTLTSIQGRSTLTISNVNVTSTGHLIASAPEAIEISGPFEVSLGGQLEINLHITKTVYMDYDASGNVIRRYKR